MEFSTSGLIFMVLSWASIIGMCSFCCFVYLVTLLEDFRAFTASHLIRCQEINSTVMVFIVVPFHKQADPFTGRFNGFKTLRLVVGSIFQSLK